MYLQIVQRVQRGSPHHLTKECAALTLEQMLHEEELLRGNLKEAMLIRFFKEPRWRNCCTSMRRQWKSSQPTPGRLTAGANGSHIFSTVAPSIRELKYNPHQGVQGSVSHNEWGERGTQALPPSPSSSSPPPPWTAETFARNTITRGDNTIINPAKSTQLIPRHIYLFIYLFISCVRV